jgi:hypothetical protein
LRQYIDESTEYEIKREPEKPDTCPIDKPIDVKAMDTKPIEVKAVDTKPIEMKAVEMKAVEPVSVKPVAVKPVEMANVFSEPKQNISFNDQLETFEIPVEEDSLHIGDDIPLNMLSFEDLEKATPCDIDLGIVEL